MYDVALRNVYANFEVALSLGRWVGRLDPAAHRQPLHRGDGRRLSPGPDDEGEPDPLFVRFHRTSA